MSNKAMYLNDIQRNRLRLWRRWSITFDWFNYPPAMQRVHQAMLIHRQPWTTRALSSYTNLPQTSIRRHLKTMEQGGAVEQTPEGVRLTDLQVAFSTSFHKALVEYVRGGKKLNPELVRILKSAPGNQDMNWEMLENHIWWPVIDAPDFPDA
ncbi:helix-turn-helix transcriptional regulator [Ruegeria pomeroyi]|nr:helix-turn-helix transcriptional regulator [Ruegeria pomeroyi]